MLVDVFENFGNMYLEIYEIDPAHFLTSPEIAWEAALKHTKIKLHLLTDLLLKVVKGIRVATCHAIHRYAKANNKYMKDFDKNKELSYLKYCDVNKLCGWAMSQKLSVNNCKWVEDIYEFNEDFIRSYNAESDEGCFLEVDVQHPENLRNLHNDLPFSPGKMKIEKTEGLEDNLHDKTEYVIHIRNLKEGLNHGLVF